MRSSRTWLLALAALHASAADNPLRVYMSGDYMPLHGVEGDARVGLEAELAQLLGKALGRPVVFVDRESTGATSFDAVATGKADVALNAITPTRDRASRVDFTRPYVTVPLRVVGLGERIVEAQDLKGKKVAIAPGPAATALAPLKARWIRRPTLAAAVQAANLKGPADFAAGEEPALAQEIAGTEFQLIGPSLGDSPIAMAVPKGRAREYDDLLAKIEGDLKLLRERWSMYLRSFQRVAAGSGFACAVADGGGLACFGPDLKGRAAPPEGQFAEVVAGADHACAIRIDRTVACWGSNENGKATPPPGKFRSLAAGRDHTCGLRVAPDGNSEVICWGRSVRGLSKPSASEEYAALAVGRSEKGDPIACALNRERSPICWGFGEEPRTLKVGMVNWEYLWEEIAMSGSRLIGVSRREINLWEPGSPKTKKLENTTAGYSIRAGEKWWCAKQDDSTLWCKPVSCPPPNECKDLVLLSGAHFGDLSVGEGDTICGALTSGGLVCQGVDTSQARLPGGAMRLTWKPPAPRSPDQPVRLAVCADHWRIIGTLTPHEGLEKIPLGSPQQYTELTWWTADAQGTRKVDLTQDCGKAELAASAPLKARPFKKRKEEVNKGATSETRALVTVQGLGELELSWYEYTPAAANIDEGAVAAHANADVGRGALDPCSGYILTWTEGRNTNQLDDGGCTEGD